MFVYGYVCEVDLPIKTTCKVTGTDYKIIFTILCVNASDCPYY